VGQIESGLTEVYCISNLMAPITDRVG